LRLLILVAREGFLKDKCGPRAKKFEHHCSCTKNKEPRPTNTFTHYCSLINHSTLWLWNTVLLHQYGGVVTFTMRKNVTHSVISIT